MTTEATGAVYCWVREKYRGGSLGLVAHHWRHQGRTSVRFPSIDSDNRGYWRCILLSQGKVQVLRPGGSPCGYSSKYIPYRGGSRIFEKGGSILGLQAKKGGPGGGSILSPMLKSLHRGSKRTPPPLDLPMPTGKIATGGIWASTSGKTLLLELSYCLL